MKGALADVARVRAYIYGSGSQADAAAAANQLDEFGKGLPTLFPPKSAPNEYVDMSPERVRAAPQAVTAAAQALSTAITTGERAQVAKALETMERNGCGVCHRPAAVPHT
ncbi:MAG: cytochrome c [Caulobacteraceae bacterium]|nr:cytochrome c [Caulobacteraceae bacterium]